MNKFDRYIKKVIQSCENPLPDEVEKKFLKTLNDLKAPAKKVKLKIHRPFIFKPAFLTSMAAFITAILLIVNGNVNKPPLDNQVAKIINAKVDGMVANTYMFQTQKPDMTVFWIEKGAKQGQ